MKAKNKMYFMKTLSAVLAASMAASVFTAVPVFAETGSATYTYDGYKVDYTVTNEWFGNQNVNVTLTNTSSESILNWALGYDATGEISGIWNGYVYCKSDENYIIKNSGYNYEIEPYQSVNFGYTLSGNELEAPENFELCSKRVDKTEGYDVKLNVTGDWGDGFQAELIVTNTSDAPLEAWKVDFDSNFEIGNLWNGKIIESNDDGYSIASCMWTNPIASGESTSIGFTASKETSETPAVSNIKLSEVIIDRSGSVPSDDPVEPGEDELNITADAQYIENDGTAVISWNTNVNNGTFEVMYSEDNVEYTQIASVSDAKTYTYALGDIYGTVYFKVRQTTEGGQVAESSALSVDIPVPVVPEKPVVTLSAEYDKETGYVNVLWETTVEGGNFDIYVSVDSGEFEKKASVSDTISYSFPSEVSGSYDIKVVQTTAAGMTGESSVVNVVCTIPDPADDIDWEDETDSDEDGISDVYETYIYFTDPHNPDTDSDGLPDGYEVFTLDTDPLSSDTDVNGVSDGDEDIDGDGLNNLREFELGTDPRDVDSDDDGLSDADEINIYGTDPLKYDTDDDNVSDGDEITLGLDPNSAATDGIPDNERTFEQFIPADDWLFYNINVDSSPVEVSIELDAAGVAINNIEATFSGYSYSMHNDAIVGVAPEFSYNENLKINDVKINFDLDNSIVNDYNSMYNDVSDEFVGIKRFNVFRYFEDTNMLLPIETFHDVPNNRVYAHYNEMGTYCLIDMTKWLDSLGYMHNSDQSAMTFAMERTAEATESNEIDIIFILHSIPSQAQFIKEELTKFISAAYMHSNDVRMYFIANQGDVYLVNGKQYAETPAECENILNRFRGYVTSPTINAGFEAANKIEFRNGSQRHMFMIDACAEPQCIDTNANLNIILKKDVNFGIVFDPANGNAKNYKSLANNNTFDAIVTFSDFMLNQINFTDYPKNKEYIITANGLVPMPENFGDISIASEQDYDNDGLSDVTEINFDVTGEDGNTLITVNSDGSVTLPIFSECIAREDICVINSLNRFYTGTEHLIPDFLNKVKIVPLRSDPTSKDGDGDGIPDITEMKKAYKDGKIDTTVKTATNPLVANTIVNILEYDGVKFNTKIENVENINEETGDVEIKPQFTLAKEHENHINSPEEGIEFAYGFLGNDTDAFYLEAFAYRDDTDKVVNELMVNINVGFSKKDFMLADGSSGKVSSDEMLEAVIEKWGGLYKGSDYDFYNLTNLQVKININKVTNSTGVEKQRIIRYMYTANDSEGKAAKVKTEELNFEKNYSGKKVTVDFYDYDKGKKSESYTGRSKTDAFEKKDGTLKVEPHVKLYAIKKGSEGDEKKQSAIDIKSTCAHEFGHVLGLGDSYGPYNPMNYFVEPVSRHKYIKYDGKSDIDYIDKLEDAANVDYEIYFNNGVFSKRPTDGETDGSSKLHFEPDRLTDSLKGEMMQKNGLVNTNDIEMMIFAKSTNEEQFFVPIGRTCTYGATNDTYITNATFPLSKAIRQKSFYIFTRSIKIDDSQFDYGRIYWYDGKTYKAVEVVEKTETELEKQKNEIMLAWGDDFDDVYYNHVIELCKDANGNKYFYRYYGNNYCIEK